MNNWRYRCLRSFTDNEELNKTTELINDITIGVNALKKENIELKAEVKILKGIIKDYLETEKKQYGE